MTELVRTYKLTDSGAWGWVTEESEGGGGGSLPSWWTVDSTPGSESVEFAGAVTISPSGNVRPLGITGADGSTAQLISVEDFDGNVGFALEADGFFAMFGVDGSNQFVKDASGAVTISPSGGAAPLTLVGLPTADPTVVGQLWNDTGTLKASAG